MHTVLQATYCSKPINGEDTAVACLPYAFFNLLENVCAKMMYICVNAKTPWFETSRCTETSSTIGWFHTLFTTLF